MWFMAPFLISAYRIHKQYNSRHLHICSCSADMARGSDDRRSSAAHGCPSFFDNYRNRNRRLRKGFSKYLTTSDYGYLITVGRTMWYGQISLHAIKSE